MTNAEFYKLTESDYDDAISRLMNDNLIRKFILKFKSDPSYDELRRCVEAGDIEGSFTAAHTLKGVSANLGFRKLYTVTCELVEQLRPRSSVADLGLVQKVEDAYSLIIRMLNQLEAEDDFINRTASR